MYDQSSIMLVHLCVVFFFSSNDGRFVLCVDVVGAVVLFYTRVSVTVRWRAPAPARFHTYAIHTLNVLNMF